MVPSPTGDDPSAGEGFAVGLIVILEDATSEIYYAQLVEEESTVAVLAALREVVHREGVFCASGTETKEAADV